jgi:sugar lactone lactonase YvrE
MSSLCLPVTIVQRDGVPGIEPAVQGSFARVTGREPSRPRMEGAHVRLLRKERSSHRMIKRARLTVLAFVIVALAAYSDLLTAKRRKYTAQEENGIPQAIAQEMAVLRRILTESPGDPAALFSLAMDEATVRERTKAIELLEQMSLAHSGLDPRPPAGRPFGGLEDDPRFRALVAKIEKENPPVIRSTRALVLKERDLAPEGIAYDPVDRKFYISSVSKRKIVCVSEGGIVTDFKRPEQDGLGQTLGMKVDAKRRFLWVVSDSSAPGGAAGESSISSSPDEHYAVFQYDLRTGALRFKHLLPPGTSGFLNDVALASTGEGFVTNSGTGGVFRLSPDRDGIELFLPANTVPQANGIAVSSNDRVLFVAGWLGVARVDIASRQIKMLSKPRNISDAGLDGMYFYKGTLVGIQNPDLHPGRIVRYYLNSAMDHIKRAEVLESYNPVFEVPTTGAPVDDSLYFMANTQVDKLTAKGAMPPPNTLQDIIILKLKL